MLCEYHLNFKNKHMKQNVMKQKANLCEVLMMADFQEALPTPRCSLRGTCWQGHPKGGRAAVRKPWGGGSRKSSAAQASFMELESSLEGSRWWSSMHPGWELSQEQCMPHTLFPPTRF